MRTVFALVIRTASQNPSLSGFVNTSFHVWHPSVVLYSRDKSPLPLDITIAVFASNACTPRKSRCSAPGGTAHACHRYPPSSVRSTVPFVPEAHATPEPTLSMPRKSAAVPELSISHCARAILQTAKKRNAIKYACRLITNSVGLKGNVQVSGDQRSREG